MTRPTPPPGAHWSGSLAARLALAFVAVTLVAIGLLAGLTLWAARSSVDGLVRAERGEATTAIVMELTGAYAQAGGWAAADLRPAAARAVGTDARLEVRTTTGRMLDDPVLAMQQRMNTMRGAGDPGPVVELPVVVDGKNVGTAMVSFSAGEPEAATRVRDALAQTVATGTGLGVIVALAVAIPIARRITRPIGRLTDATRRLHSGDRDARVGATRGFAEVTELGAAFDRMADTLVAQDELRQALVTDVAHELRTPVTILQASCEEMVDGLAQPTHERLVSLHQEVLRLGRVVEDLEHLAAARSAQVRLARRPVDLAVVTAGALDLIRPRADEAGVGLRPALETATVSGDPDRLHQIITNLLTNAVKLTPAGGTVTVRVGPSGDGIVELVVADTGPGIDPDELAHVFDRFWRGRASGGTDGSGVGLTVVAELVRAHEAEIEVASTPGAGAAFTVRFPRHPAAHG